MKRGVGNALERERGAPWALPPFHARSTLYLFIFCLALKSAVSGTADSNTFSLFHDGVQGCLGVRDSVLYMFSSCEDEAQRWKWVTRGRMFNLGSSLCLGLTVGNGSTSRSPLNVYTCDHEPLKVRWTWYCGQVLENLNTYMPFPAMVTNTSTAKAVTEGSWRVYGDDQDLCAKSYQEIYTIQGNSQGRPCFLPFLYDGQWFHSCTSVGREDGHLWCATTYDYGKDERWGFCPIKSNGCETFWDTESLMDNCYQFNFQAALSWSEARTSCQQQGASLLSITKVEEQSYINGLLTGYSASLWMGLNDLDLTGGWQWADSSPLKYMNWEPDQPKYEDEQNCAVIRTETSGRWQNRDCSIALPYVCKKRPNATMDPFTTDSWADDDVYQCDVGWQAFQAGCYRLTTDKMDWNSAEKTCLKMEAHLVSIHTLPELEFIVGNMKKDSVELWIGLHDMALEMNFEWTDRTPVIFTYWHPFEPNNFRNTQEDCVTLWGPEGRWNDSPCNFTLPSICKKPAQKVEGKKHEHGCKQDWHWHNPACFLVGEELVTYDEAKKTCAVHEATLVTISNRFEQAFVNSLVFGRSGDSFWIGLQDEANTGTYSWVSGGPVSYTNWNRDQPAAMKGGCVTMATGHATGLWEVRECAVPRSKYICRQNKESSSSPALPSPAPTPSLTGNCPSEWKTSSKIRYCYKVFSQEQLQQSSWIKALVNCHAHGANLLSVNGPEEEAFIEQILHETFGESEDHEQHWFWIGLHRRNPLDNDSWKWSDGLAYTYQNFARYYSPIHKCVAMDLGTKSWLPMHCESKLDWICKIPKGAVEKEPETSMDSGMKWVAFEEAEYRFSEHRSSWDQAQRICSWVDASLASIHSAAEGRFLKNALNQMIKTDNENWWLGMYTYENDGRFHWSDHSVLNYVSWASGQPHTISRDRKCVYMSTSSGDWTDQKCHTDLRYICKRVNITGTIPPTPSTPLQSAGCADGWTPFLHKCYKVFGHDEFSRVTWPTAHSICQSQGAAMATVHSHVEQAFLITLLPNTSFHLWVGLTSDFKSKFQWAEPGLLSYTNWAPGEPVDNSGTHPNKSPANCVLMLHGSPARTTGMWASRGCETEKHGYICMKNKDPAQPASTDSLPPSLSGPLEFEGMSYRLLQKRLDWEGALQVCESLNGTLAVIRDPRQQAYLTLLLHTLRKPAWIGLQNDMGRIFSWLGMEELTYTAWRDGESNQMVGCGQMNAVGLWTVSSCEAKLNNAICEINPERTVDHRWMYPGHCPQAVDSWSWVPFRNSCYSFNLQQPELQHTAVHTCSKVGAKLLSVLDESENSFIWEHMQSYQEQAHGAWLGMSFNPKGGVLQWLDNVAVRYTNWELQDANLSMLSPNTCFWMQSNTGLWKPSPCKNHTHGVICKRPRGQDASSVITDGDHVPALVFVILVSALALMALVVGVIYLYRRQMSGSGGSYEGARYSRTNSTPSEQMEKNILVSDMELNEQPE